MVSKTFVKVLGIAGSILITIFAGLFAMISLSALFASIINMSLLSVVASAAAGFVAWILWSIRKDTLVWVVLFVQGIVITIALVVEKVSEWLLVQIVKVQAILLIWHSIPWRGLRFPLPKWHTTSFPLMKMMQTGWEWGSARLRLRYALPATEKGKFLKTTSISQGGVNKSII